MVSRDVGSDKEVEAEIVGPSPAGEEPEEERTALAGNAMTARKRTESRHKPWWRLREVLGLYQARRNLRH